MSVQLISAKEIPLYMDGTTVLVDMRKREEYETYHFPGAISCPYHDYEEWLRSLPESRAYILYCDRGNMSLYAAKRLDREGKKVFTVAGGAEGWKRRGTKLRENN